MPQGGGGGGNSYYSNATAWTDLDPAALGAHYAAQLGDVGWTARGERHEGPIAWSAWTFQDGCVRYAKSGSCPLLVSQAA